MEPLHAIADVIQFFLREDRRAESSLSKTAKGHVSNFFIALKHRDFMLLDPASITSFSIPSETTKIARIAAADLLVASTH